MECLRNGTLLTIYKGRRNLAVISRHYFGDSITDVSANALGPNAQSTPSVLTPGFLEGPFAERVTGSANAVEIKKSLKLKAIRDNRRSGESNNRAHTDSIAYIRETMTSG